MSTWICRLCGYEQEPKWTPVCVKCVEYNTFVLKPEMEPSTEAEEPDDECGDDEYDDSEFAQNARGVETPDVPRMETNLDGIDRILGGGIAEGSVVLMAGHPGCGKSTCAAQVCISLDRRHTVLYVSGEESNKQVIARMRRLGMPKRAGIQFLHTRSLEVITAEIERLKPSLAVIDSIQMIASEDIRGTEGSASQIKGVTQRLVEMAKDPDCFCAMLIIGHVNKEGALAGPKTLEHLVDVVVDFGGERAGGWRIVRTIKNRFGSSGTMAMYEMTKDGLREIEDPRSTMLEDRPEDVPGSVLTIYSEDSFVHVVDLQASVSQCATTTPRRDVLGIEAGRVRLITQVMGAAKVGVDFAANDVMVNIRNHTAITDPAVDLAVATAILSSGMEISLPSDLVVLGEIGLAGEVRSVSRCLTRLEEALHLGFRQALIPSANHKRKEVPEGLKSWPIRNVRELEKWIEKNGQV